MPRLFYLLSLIGCLLLVGCDTPTSSLADDDQDLLITDAATGEQLAGVPFGKQVPERNEFGFGFSVPGSGVMRDRLVDNVRIQTARFADVEAAIAAGYVSTEECVYMPGVGAMGFHFVNPDLASDAEINPFEPEILLYVPESGGTMRLVAVEYFVSREAWEATPGNEHRTPFLAGVPFDQHFGPALSHGQPDHYDLHLWAHQENPLGMFAPFNPAVSCEQTITVSALTLNIWHNQGDWPRRLNMIVDSLRALDPDVIFLQEVLQDVGLPNQAETIANSLGYHYYFASVDPPERIKRYGNAILTREPILESDWKRLVEGSRVIAYVRTEVEGQPIDVYVTHLHHTAGGGAIRRSQIVDALAFIDRTIDNAPILFGGDFNAVISASEMRPLDARFADAYGTVHPDAGNGPTTLNTALGHTARRIDHVFFEKDAGWQPTAAEVVLDEMAPDGTWASDHFGVYTRFTLTYLP